MMMMELAHDCASAIALDLLVAISAIESGLDPLSVSDGPRLHRYATVGHAVSGAVGAIDSGHLVGIGITGVSSVKLAELGVSLADGFKPCANMRAAQVVMQQAYREADKRGFTPAAADRAVIVSWYRPGGRWPTTDAYVGAVEAARTTDTLMRADVRGAVDVASKEMPPAASGKGAPPEVSSLPAVPKAERVRQAEPWDVFGELSTQGSADLIESAN